jgi:hypothetical protein
MTDDEWADIEWMQKWKNDNLEFIIDESHPISQLWSQIWKVIKKECPVNDSSWMDHHKKVSTKARKIVRKYEFEKLCKEQGIDPKSDDAKVLAALMLQNENK